MNFFDSVDIFYINLDNRVDRRNYIENHLKELNINSFRRVKAYSPKDFSSKISDEGMKMGANEYSIAGGYSHLLALKDFVENSNKDLALILEDDADLSNVNKFNFHIEDMFNYLHNEISCLQLSVSTREDIVPNFKVRLRSNWDFCAGAYIVTKKYAKFVTDYYLDNGYFNVEKFKSFELLDYRNNGIINTVPVPESIVYNLTNVIVFPIFTYMISNTSMSFSTEAQRQEIKSRQDFINHWSKYDRIFLRDLI